MGISLINSAQKASYEAAFENLHVTFGRNITAVFDKTNAQVNSSPSFDYFSDVKPENITTEPTSYTILARIRWWDKPEASSSLLFSAPGQEGQVGPRLRQEYGDVRIKVRNADSSPLFECDRVIIDNTDCAPLTNSRFHGIVDLQFTTFYFVRRL